ncbi:MAG: carbohydrate-binding protein [Verrucomicrobiales bacterium]|nr:carbohydrate-binding protein [Verrucomicrobiales bacterium]
MKILARLRLCPVLWLIVFALHEASGQVVRPIPVPGRIEAENYDTNGPGVSYYDNTSGNSGGAYRSDDVDIEVTSDTGGGYNVGYIASGEWLNYTVNVQTTAVYQVAFRVASANGTGNIQVVLDGIPLCSATTPFTGGWQTWQTVTISNLVMTTGQHLLRLDFAVGGQNLNYLQVTKQRDLTGGFLRVSGKQIVDAQGQNVILRGMGLGNWMLQEPYMMDVSGIANTQQQLKNKIAELVGTNNMQAFYASWLTNSLREADVAALAAAGFNSIRLPMHYNLFTLPIEQEPVPGQNTWLTDGFKLVDDLLGWCETNHIYLILDMHACPGGEGHDQSISDYNPPAPSLWENSTNRTKLVALWRELATHYANNAWIGGYDLINEPNWTFEDNANISGCGDQTNIPLRQMLGDITAAIRQVDTNHIIFLEGNCWAGNYNGILPPWDDNLVISFHKYWDQPTAASLQPWVDKRNQWNMPVWLGESGENSNEWFRDVIRAAEQANIGWSWWPWKKIGTLAGPTIIQKPAGYQAILNYWNSTGPRPSTNDAFNALLALAQAARYENCVVRPDVIDALMRPNTAGVTLPFKNHSVPGVIFAADYDMGRPGEAYLDQTTNSPYNSGSSYRNDSVDIEVCSDSAPTLGYDVGWLDPGDWMKYTVPIAAGPFSISPRVAANAAGGSFYVEVGGSNVTGLINVPATGGWQSWITLSPRIFTNASPANSFRVLIVTGGFNLHWLQFTSLLPAAPAGLAATASSAQVALNWSGVSGAISYNIKRAATSGGNYTTIATGVSGTNYTDTAITNGTTVYYIVTAINTYGESAPSNEASVVVPFPRLSASASFPNVRLSWSNPASILMLRSTTSLVPPVAWMPVTNAPSFQNGVWQIYWYPDDAVRFFRLSE